MTIVYHHELIQGSDDWMSARKGMLTASEMHFLVTPTFKIASNDKEKSHLFELLAQRITGYVEPSYISDSMLRGQNDEIEARELYHKTYAPVIECGFVTNDKYGFLLGYSPDGLVGDNGQIECKSRKQSLQAKTILEYVSNETIDPAFMIQAQTGLMVTERDWCDLISYCGGMPMATVRVFQSKEIQAAILCAATEFESRLMVAQSKYETLLESKARLIPTIRKIELEMHL